jgi:hypothetical protein
MFFEIIKTQPSCRYRCLDFEISIGTPEICCLGGIGLVDGNLIANDTINASLHPHIHCKLCSFVYLIEIVNHPLWHLSVSICLFSSLFLSSELCLSGTMASESDLGIDLV